jgi:acetyl esterase/lipase
MLAVLSLTVAAHSQTVHAVHMVGQRDLGWTNPTKQGSPLLFTRVLYPSATGGVNAPIEPCATGWPVIVFLHGYAILGRDYVELASHWVSSGFAVVLVDSSMFAFFDEAADAVAQHAAILAANHDEGSFFHGAFDTGRMAIAGHSMGGGAMALALANNPGYRCGFALAPAWPGTSWTSQVTVPMAIAVGDGDVVTPWYLHAFPYYLSLMPQSGLKTWYLLDGECGHMNIVGLAGAQDPAFARIADLTVGFFRHFLDIDPSGLDRCLGPCVANTPQLLMHDTAIVQPRLWSDQSPAVGTIVRISIAT